MQIGDPVRAERGKALSPPDGNWSALCAVRFKAYEPSGLASQWLSGPRSTESEGDSNGAETAVAQR